MSLREVSRLEFLQRSGALIVASGVGFGAASAPAVAAAGRWPAVVDPTRIDNYLAIGKDGRVTAYVGKIEAGMGISTSWQMIVADLMDVPLDRVDVVMGDTYRTVDMGGTGGSQGIHTGWPVFRALSGQARAILVARAAQKLGADPTALTVVDGVVMVGSDRSRSVAYADLIGPAFDAVYDPKFTGKSPSDYKIIGKPTGRRDLGEKVRATYPYMANERLTEMVHARVVRPRVHGARLVSVPPGQTFPGLIGIVTKGNFVAVACEREEQAIRAARALRVQWDSPAATFPTTHEEIFEYLRTTSAQVSKKGADVGNVEAAFSAGSGRMLEAAYMYPFQSHASMGPASAVADVRNGTATVWMGSQKPYSFRAALAQILGLTIENVRVIWRPGPGSYGMNDADDCAMDAAVIAQQIGRPVRLQYMRADATAWDPKGPPALIYMRGALDPQGNVTAWDYTARGFSGNLRPSRTSKPGDSLIGQLMGLKPDGTDEFPLPSESYTFPNKRTVAHILPWDQSYGTGLRTSHIRDPWGPQTTFASESFVDEMAAAAGVDPVEFRLRSITAPRDLGVIKAVAARADWTNRRAALHAQRDPNAKIARGIGIAYAPRSGSYVATVAEVEVDRSTGNVRVRRFTCAHDCGFVINPKALHGTVEANLVQSMSRTLHEEVRFSRSAVTSVDWLTYPIADIAEMPDEMDIVLVSNQPDVEANGAGEPSSRPTAAAIGNAIFDATGVRLRRVPFTPERVLAALHGLA